MIETSKAASAKPVTHTDLPVETPKKATFHLIFSIKKFLAGGHLERLVESIRKNFSGKKEAEQTVSERVLVGVSSINASGKRVNNEFSFKRTIQVAAAELARIPVISIQSDPLELFDEKPASAAATQSAPTEKSTNPDSAWMEMVNRRIPEPDYTANILDAYLEAKKARATAINTEAQNDDPRNGIVSDPLELSMAEKKAKRAARNQANKLA